VTGNPLRARIDPLRRSRGRRGCSRFLLKIQILRALSRSYQGLSEKWSMAVESWRLRCFDKCFQGSSADSIAGSARLVVYVRVSRKVTQMVPKMARSRPPIQCCCRVLDLSMFLAHNQTNALSAQPWQRPFSQYFRHSGSYVLNR
jgi:hypothetical protein